MFALAKFVYTSLWPTKPENWYLDEMKRINAAMDAIDDDPNCQQFKAENSYIPDSQWFTFQGRITRLSANDGFINENLYFNREMAQHLHLQEDYIVECLARKISEDIPVQIYKINSIVQENWDMGLSDLNYIQPIDTNPTAIPTHERLVFGRVKNKTGGLLLIETYEANIKFVEVQMTEIKCTFIPMAGDEVSLLILFQHDASVLNYAGIPIGVYSIMPANSKEYVGIIEKFPKKKDQMYGVIDKDYVFYLDALLHSDNIEHKPDVGDSVIAEVIESNQKLDFKSYNWRCIKIIKNVERNSNQANEPIDNSTTTDKNLNGIFITGSTDLKVTFDRLNETKTVQIIVENKSDRPHRIVRAEMAQQILSSQINCPELQKSWTIQASRKHVYNIEVIGKLFGISRLKMDFSFDGGFVLSRCIEINVKAEIPETMIDDTEPTGVQIKRNKAYTQNVFDQRIDVVPGRRLVTAPHFIAYRLKPFEVSQALLKTVLDTANYTQIDDKLTEILPSYSRLDFKNYERFFHDMLHLEEIHLHHEFRKYDRDREHFRREGEYLALQMKNVLESRPSIVIGDCVYAQDPWQNNDDEEMENCNGKTVQYQGYIHKVKKNSLLIKFDDNFHSQYHGEDYRLVFKFSRSKFMKQHNAVERMRKNCDAEFLFPSNLQCQKKLQLDVNLVDENLVLNFRKQKIDWFNSKLNIVQKKAVECVLRGETRPMPYVIFGPPGTGKTSTVVELILQIFKRVGGSRLIVAAPSNSAANLITKRLIESNAVINGQFIRIISQNSIEREQIPDELHPHCVTVDIAAPKSTMDSRIQTDSGLILNCNSVVLSSHRIIISTCTSFGSLLHMKFPLDHFTHAIIDEAGQCLEPEVMIPISLVSKKTGQIILAGDPMQLGPIVHSPFAKNRGFDKSLLIRLLDRVPYQRGVETVNYDPRLVTKLLYNYRSLPSILSTYSELFYESELIATISEVDSDEAKLLNMLKEKNVFEHTSVPTANYGVYFVGVRGHEEQTMDSTSWRNPEETYAVHQMLTTLLRCGLEESDIGIITPYILQVKDIRDLCKSLDVELPKIGSVEEFQGQERKVIIISTVRSKSKSIVTDKKHNLGFIESARRLNVAISRARAVLIIFGNPDLLINDGNWRSLIINCHNNGTYLGCDFPRI